MVVINLTYSKETSSFQERKWTYEKGQIWEPLKYLLNGFLDVKTVFTKMWCEHFYSRLSEVKKVVVFLGSSPKTGHNKDS